MEKIKELLSERKRYLEQIIKEKTAALAGAPPGHLRVCHHKNRNQYFLRENPKDFSGRYISKKDMHIAGQLAQKEYDEKIMKSADKELRAIEKYLAAVPDVFPEQIYENLHQARKPIINPIRKPDEEYIKEWERVRYTGLQFYEDSQRYYTDKNERVRSKSEIIIANKLAKENLPYRYEYPLHLKGWGTVYPDFTILDIKTRREIYWEHLGRMDKEDYLEDNLKKLAAYEKNGIFPGDRLILSFETQKSPIDQKIIGLLIQKHFK